jgi:hypothetical protein
MGTVPMRGSNSWIHPVAWMIGLAAAAASTILVNGAIATAVGPSLYFRRLFTEPDLLLATLAYIGCTFTAGLCISQAIVLLLKTGTNRRS